MFFIDLNGTVCGEHACVVHMSMFMYAHTESRGGRLVPLHHSLAYSVETGSLSEVGTRLVAPVTLLSLSQLPQGNSSQLWAVNPWGVGRIADILLMYQVFTLRFIKVATLQL